jgi:hypothetical protein
LQDLSSGRIAQQITADARAHALKEFALIFRHADQQYADSGSGGSDLLYGRQVFLETSARVKEEYVWPGVK